jgi:ABC-type uncharacterized transport system permease subunit
LQIFDQGWYNTSSYFIAKNVVELPLCLLTTLLYYKLSYSLSNQISESFREWSYFMVNTGSVLIAQGIGFLVGAVAQENDKLAISLVIGIFMYEILLSGFFAPIKEFPLQIKWIAHLAYLKQSYEMQINVIYGFGRCPEGQESTLLNGLTDQDQFWVNAVLLVIQIILFRLIALLTLLYKANRRGNM